MGPEPIGSGKRRPCQPRTTALWQRQWREIGRCREPNRHSLSPHSFFLTESFNFQRPYAVASGHGPLRATEPLAYTRRTPSHHHGRPLDGPKRPADALHLDPDTFGRADVDDDQVVLDHADQTGQGIGHPQEVLPAESALKNRQLQPGTKPFHGFVDPAPTLLVGDVVAHQVDMIHAASPGHKGGVSGYFTGQVTDQQPGLHLEEPSIADAVVENRVGDLLAQPPLESGDEALPAGRLQIAPGGGGDKILPLDLAVVDGANSRRSRPGIPRDPGR